MGCDIHAYVEVKHYPYEDENREHGFWVSADKWSVNVDHNLHPEDYPRKFDVDYDDYIYKGRNYYLFAILANVRNYRGFTPISEPKGLPKDVSEEIKQLSDDYGSDGHSHSYLTLKELLNYNWNQEIEAVDLFGTKEKANEKLGDSIVDYKYNNGFGLDVTYKTTIAKTMPEFMETIEKLKKFLRDSDYPYWKVTEEDIRLVFWFDN